MSIRRVSHVAAVVFSLASAVVSYQLLVKHVSGSAAAGWFEAGCQEDTSPGAANCAAVLASPYSYFPPKTSDPADRRPRLPVAFLGLAYYSSLAVWLLGVGRVSPQRRWLHAIPLLSIGFGLAMSAYFTAVMFRKLDQWCPWCMVTHGLNVLIAAGVVLMWPGRPRAAAAATPSTSVRMVAYPSVRVVFVTGLAIVALAAAQLFLLGLKTWRRQVDILAESNKALTAALHRLKGDADLHFRNWQSATQRAIAIDADDPARIGAGAQAGHATLDVVVFSDFECPMCARFAEFVESQAQPLFAGHLKVIFKHYPIDRSCNDRASQTMHKHACEGVALVEAARALAGNDGFWRAHDYVYKHRDALAAGRLTPQMTAAAIGVDAGALTAATQSEQMRRRVAEDVDQAKVAEVRGTPAVFVEGKLVDPLVVTEVGFWDRLADMYWQRTGIPRPASTKPKTAATPSTPDRKDAP